MAAAFPFELDPPTTPALGLIVLSVDETIEQEFRADLAGQAARLHVSRVAAGEDLTPGSIEAMSARLTDAARLFPPDVSFDVIGYACTSATAALGAENVAARIRAGARAVAVTDPLSAVVAQAAALRLHRVAVVSPYTPEVAQPLRTALEARGLAIPEMLSFGESREAHVARIAPESIMAATRAVAARVSCDAVFLSCTNLRTRDILGPLSTALGKPVLSSNHALYWHMCQLAGFAQRTEA